jgi:hypothetical protein
MTDAEEWNEFPMRAQLKSWRRYIDSGILGIEALLRIQEGVMGMLEDISCASRDPEAYLDKFVAHPDFQLWLLLSQCNAERARAHLAQHRERAGHGKATQ